MAATRLITLLIAAALAVAAVGVALMYWQPESALGYSLRQWGLNGGQLCGLLLLVHTGTILPSTYFNVIAGCLALALLGALCTLLHWHGGRELLLAGLLGILLTYSVKFFRKSPKTRLDVLKWLWVLVATVGAAGLLLHWLPREIIYVSHGLFWLAVLDVVFTNSRKQVSRPE